jgi:hypothetical protein
MADDNGNPNFNRVDNPGSASDVFPYLVHVYNLIYKFLPFVSTALLVVLLTTALIYSVGFNQPIPSGVVIASWLIYGIFLLVFVVGFLFLYFRKTRPSPTPAGDIESGVPLNHLPPAGGNAGLDPSVPPALSNNDLRPGNHDPLYFMRRPQHPFGTSHMNRPVRNIEVHLTELPTPSNVRQYQGENHYGQNYPPQALATGNHAQDVSDPWPRPLQPTHQVHTRFYQEASQRHNFDRVATVGNAGLNYVHNSSANVRNETRRPSREYNRHLHEQHPYQSNVAQGRPTMQPQGIYGPDYQMNLVRIDPPALWCRSFFPKPRNRDQKQFSFGYNQSACDDCGVEGRLSGSTCVENPDFNSQSGMKGDSAKEPQKKKKVRPCGNESRNHKYRLHTEMGRHADKLGVNGEKGEAGYGAAVKETKTRRKPSSLETNKLQSAKSPPGSLPSPDCAGKAENGLPHHGGDSRKSDDVSELSFEYAD